MTWSTFFIRGLEAESKLVAGQVFNVGNDGMNYQIRQLAQFVLDVIPNVKVHDIPDDPDKHTYNVSFAKIKQMLGFEVRTRVARRNSRNQAGAGAGRVRGTIPRVTRCNGINLFSEWEKRIQGLSINGKLLSG